MNLRLFAIDVLRGMTIFFMIIVNTPGTWQYVYAPLKHAPWNGWTPTDLVFPFFVFIVGLAMSYSFRKYQDDKAALSRKILKRTAAILLVGLVLNWYPFFNKSLGDLRYFGVLQRIALAYGLGALIVVYTKERVLPIILAGLLVGYWVLLLLGGTPPDPLSLENNLVRIVDLAVFGEKHVYHGYGIPFDPEGLLSTLPAAGTVILGYLIGKRMQKLHQHFEKVKMLIIAGVASVIAGYLWQYLGFPINKPIWSSSYVLLTGGLAMIILAILIYIIDILAVEKWTFIFKVFGLNPLISYVLSGLVIKTFFLIKIGEQNLYGWMYSQVFQVFFGDYLGSLMQALFYTFFIWFFAWLLYRRGRVIKL
jgi:predicted acyltransferase